MEEEVSFFQELNMKEEIPFFQESDLSIKNIKCLENINTIKSDVYLDDENGQIDNPPTGSTQCTTCKKKKGRPKLDEHRENSSSIHSRNSRDNVLRKIKSALCRHIINLLNKTVKVNKINRNYIKFYNLLGKDSGNITRNHCKRLLKMNIEQFLIKMRKSKKYKGDGSNADTVKKIKENPNYMKIFKPLLRLPLKDYYFHVFLKNSNIISPKYDKVFQEIQKNKKSFNNILEKQEDDEYAQLLKETAEDFVGYFSG